MVDVKKGAGGPGTVSSDHCCARPDDNSTWDIGQRGRALCPGSQPSSHNNNYTTAAAGLLLLLWSVSKVTLWLGAALVSFGACVTTCV